ncbi:hypothetical protein [Streptomyces sp. NPDC006446]|uniref:hypothetical protein n=1 Tax=Streptomyces sp. NPDC006446 TaxID=3154301 RepID=UPI0033A9A5C9
MRASRRPATDEPDDASRHLPGEVIGLLRRSAMESSRPGCMEAALGRLRGPVLNPGDPWADHFLTELPKPGEPWHALVEHALQSSARRPTRTWDRRAPALADPLDPGRVRHTVTPWPELAADGGGGSDGVYDPYNPPALAGPTCRSAGRILSGPPHVAGVRDPRQRALSTTQRRPVSWTK